MVTVKQLRERQHLSQEGLARKADISTATVNRMETGKTVQKSMVKLVAQALGVNPEELEGVNIKRVNP